MKPLIPAWFPLFSVETKTICKKVIVIWDKFLKLIIIILTALLFIIIAYNVIMRYIFNNSVAWADELSRFIFLWVNLLGITVVFKAKELIILDIFTRKIINKNIILLVSVIGFLLIFFVLLILFFYSIQFVFIMGHVSATLALPMKVVYLVLPISIGIMLMNCLFTIINNVADFGK